MVGVGSCAALQHVPRTVSVTSEIGTRLYH